MEKSLIGGIEPWVLTEKLPDRGRETRADRGFRPNGSWVLTEASVGFDRKNYLHEEAKYGSMTCQIRECSTAFIDPYRYLHAMWKKSLNKRNSR
jgi:hypothetical protein